MNDAVLRIIGEFIGAFLGAVLVWLAYYLHWESTEDKGLKLAVYCTGPGRFAALLLERAMTEIIGTFALVFVIFRIFAKAATGTGPASGVGPYLVACPGVGHWPEPGRTDRLCHQPGP